MTTQKRKRYTKDFKLEAIQLAKSRDCSISEVARNLGIQPNMLCRCVKEYYVIK